MQGWIAEDEGKEERADVVNRNERAKEESKGCD